MKCPFKLDHTEEHNDPYRGWIRRTTYYYVECAMTGCRMWSDILQDCRLAIGGWKILPYG